jgi:hypothetical protein
MGLIGKVFGMGGGGVRALGHAVQGVAEVFTPSATRQMELSAQAQAAAMAGLSAEFARAGDGWFDSFINGLNRLPRPALALGTVGLFVYAMVDPVAFARRMAGLNAVPEPLWWLLGAVVAFYFGARETHYFRTRQTSGPHIAPHIADHSNAPQAPDQNPALADWLAARAGDLRAYP